MAKANLVLPDGTTVTIDGTVDEVALLLERFSKTGGASGAAKGRTSRAARSIPDSTGKGERQKSKSKRTGPTDYIRELIGDGYFKSKREIGSVKDRLEESGHIYPVTSISGPLFRLVRSRELRRVKEDGVWKYVHP